jgi:hypothetical protein
VTDKSEGVRLSDEQRLDWLLRAFDFTDVLAVLSHGCRKQAIR